MIVFVLSAQTLGNTRFAVSPLAEATLSIRLLGQPRPLHIYSPWIGQVRSRLDGVDLELLHAVIPEGGWIASSLVAPAEVAHPSIEDQLSALSRSDPAVLAAELAEVWAGRAMPRRARELLDAGAGGIARLTETIWDYWDVAVRPFWPRMSAVLEDDVAFRVSHLSGGGLFDILADLHPEITMDGNRVQIDKPHHADAVNTADAMTLTPSVFAWPLLTLDDGETGRLGLTYPARGAATVWESAGDDSRSGDPLGRLLGRTRAAILQLTRIPQSTTQLARQLGQSPATVNAHLAVLRDNQLVRSRRSGRSVYYRQTPLAEAILDQHPYGLEQHSG